MRAMILFVLVGVATAVPTQSHRIVNGVPTTVEKYPFMANMQYNWWGDFFSQACGGTLISRTAVISAAHCFYGDPSIFWRVILGTSDRTTGGTTYNVASLIHHEYYDRPLSLNNDVTIVVLSVPVTFSSTIAPVKIAAAGYHLSDFDVVTAIGWGSLQSGGGSQPDQLHEAEINVIPQNICEDRYHGLKENPSYEAYPDITESMFCTGILDVGGRGACQGDSGGPVIHDGTLVGIMSWSEGCANAYFPEVNARVSVLSDWIVRNCYT